MQRLHKGLCQHFNLDPTSPVRLYIEGFGDQLNLGSNGKVTAPLVGEIEVSELKGLYLDNVKASDEDLFRFLEANASLLVRINNEKSVFDQQSI